LKHIYKKIKSILIAIAIISIFIHSMHTISAHDESMLTNEIQNPTLTNESNNQNATAIPVSDIGNPSYFFGGLLIASIFGIKIGVGSGLSNLSKKEFMPISIFYLITTAIIAYLSINIIPHYVMEQIRNIAPIYYTILALISIIAGVYTIKSLKKGNDISKKSFLVLVAPCPLLVFSIMLISTQIPFELNSILITILTTMGFVAIIAISYLLSKIKASTLHLGNLMIALGFGILTVALILPEFIKTGFNVAPTAGFMMELNEMAMIVLFFITFAILGFLKENILIKRGDY